MEHFLINSSICLFSLWLFYKLLLENTSWHQFKRFYFLVAIIISAIVPFVVVRTVVVPLNYGPAPDFTTVELNPDTIVETGFTLDWSWILWGAYLIGVLMMGFRFLRNLYDLRVKTSDEVSSYENYKLVLRELIQIPHSFFGRIYASKTDYQSGAIPEAVLQHEKAHLDEKHSIDILFIELLIVVMWFNPLLYLIKYSIKLNHEFLADQAVLSSGVSTKKYQETLLAYSSSSQNRALANTFNFPIIKKRFTIMKTNTTTVSGLLRSLAIVPVLALLVISCGQEEIIQEPVVIEVVEEPSSKMNGNLIVIKADKEEGSITIDGKEYLFEKNDAGYKFRDTNGRGVDLEGQGYTFISSDEIEEVEILEEDFPAPPPPPTALEYIEKFGGKLAFYIDNKKVSQKEAVLNIQTLGQSGVSISPDANGKMAIKISMTKDRLENMPPPPPPAAPDSLTEEEQIANGLLEIYINGNKATFNEYSELGKLKPDAWKNIAVYPTRKDGVNIFHYYGEGL